MEQSKERRTAKKEAPDVEGLVRRLRLKEAWESWVRPVLSLALLLLVLALHALELLSPWQTGTTLAVGLIVIPLAAATFRSLKSVGGLKQTGVLLCWLVTLGATSLALVASGAWPGEKLLSTRLTAHARDLEVPSSASAADLNLMVSGQLSEVGTSHYTVSATSPTESRRLTGVIDKQPASSGLQRMSSEGVNTRENRYVLSLKSPLTALRADRLEPPLKGLEVTLYRPWLVSRWLIPAMLLLAVFSLFLDAAWCLPTQPSYLPVTAGFVLTFSYLFSQAATQADAPRNVMAAGLIGAALAVPAAMALSQLSRRLFGRHRGGPARTHGPR